MLWTAAESHATERCLMSGRPPAPIEGIVAFTFAEGSDQAETLVPQYNTSAIDASLSFDELASSRTAEIGRAHV